MIFSINVTEFCNQKREIVNAFGLVNNINKFKLPRYCACIEISSSLLLSDFTLYILIFFSVKMKVQMSSIKLGNVRDDPLSGSLVVEVVEESEEADVES